MENSGRICAVKIALVGAGEYLPAMAVVDRYLLDQAGGDRRVVCLPTAAGQEGARRIAYWSDLGVEHFRGLGAKADGLPVIDRQSANDPDLAEQIAQADLVYLSGGKPDYLYRVLEGSLAWQAIQSVLTRGGVLAGCSAGAMIMGEWIMGFTGKQPGFGLLPGVLVIPHFDEIGGMWVRGIQATIGHKRSILGIDGNTALAVMDGQMQVHGTGGVTLMQNGNSIRYTNGQEIAFLQQ